MDRNEHILDKTFDRDANRARRHERAARLELAAVGHAKAGDHAQALDVLDAMQLADPDYKFNGIRSFGSIRARLRSKLADAAQGPALLGIPGVEPRPPGTAPAPAGSPPEPATAARPSRS